MSQKERERNKRLLRTYGISLDDYNRMLQEQKGVCWICQTLPPSGRLNLDHIHIKGFKTLPPEKKRQYVRRPLCFLCNVAIGKLERTNNIELNKKRLAGIVKYFKKFKMKGD